MHSHIDRRIDISALLRNANGVLTYGCLLLAPQIMAAQQGRTFETVRWTREIIDQPEVALGNPFKIARLRDGFVVFDYAQRELVAVSDAGRIKWRMGRLGSAPGEFRGANALATDAQQRTWVMDPGLNRVTIVDSTGALIRTVTPDVIAYGLVPRADGGFLALGALTHPYVVLFDSAGRTRQRLSPPAILVGKGPIETALVLASNGSELYAASRVTDWVFFTPSPTATTIQVPGPSPVPFPVVESLSVSSADGKKEPAWRPAKGTIYTSRSAHEFAGRLLILVNSKRNAARRTLDIWDAPKRRYLSSLELPVDIQDFIPISQTCIAAIVQEPEPHLERLCWVQPVDSR